EELDPFGLEFLDVLLQVLAVEAHARDAEVVELLVGRLVAARVEPFNQIDMAAIGVVADLQQAGAGARVIRHPQAAAHLRTAALAEIHHLSEAEHLIELERALEVRAVDIDMVNASQMHGWRASLRCGQLAAAPAAAFGWTPE